MLRNYSPARWAYFAAHAREAYQWQCPTVTALEELFGRRAPKMWIDEQVTHLFLTSQSRDASQSSAQIGSFSATFAGTVGRYKLTEVMLFFARYAAGVYGRSFAAFDARSVGQTFHHEFLAERRSELSQLEADREAERQRNERTGRNSHCVSREQYLAIGPDDGMHLLLQIHPTFPTEWMGHLSRFLRIDEQVLAEHILRNERVEAVVPQREVGRLDKLVRSRLVEVIDSWV